MSDFITVAPDDKVAYAHDLIAQYQGGDKIRPEVQANRDANASQLLKDYPEDQADFVMHNKEGGVVKTFNARNTPTSDFITVAPEASNLITVEPEVSFPTRPSKDFAENAIEATRQAAYKTVDAFKEHPASDVIGGAVEAVVGGGAEYIGNLVELSAPEEVIRRVRNYKMEHPDAEWQDVVLNGVIRGKGISSKAIEWMKEHAGETNAGTKAGEEAVGGIMGIPAKAVGDTARGFGAGEGTAGLAEEATNLAILGGSLAKGSKEAKKAPKGPQVELGLEGEGKPPGPPTEPPTGPVEPLQGELELGPSNRLRQGELFDQHPEQDFVTRNKNRPMPEPRGNETTQADLLKRAEIEDSWRKQGMSEEAIQLQKDELWQRHEYDSREAQARYANDQLKYIDSAFEENRPTTMEAAMDKARGSGVDVVPDANQGAVVPNEPGLTKAWNASQKQGVSKLGPLLDHIIATEKNPLINAMARLLRKMGGEVEVRSTLRDDKQLDMGKNDKGQQVASRGRYISVGNHVILHTLLGLNRHVIMHEAVHAVAINFMRNNPGHRYTTAVNYLANLVKDHPSLAGEYGIKALNDGMENGPHEFLAEASSNRGFMTKLSQIVLSKEDKAYLNQLIGDRPGMLRTAWDAFKQALGGMLHVKKDSVLEHTLLTFGRLAEENVMQGADNKKFVREKYNKDPTTWRYQARDNAESAPLPKREDPNFYTKMIDGIPIPIKDFFKEYGVPPIEDIKHRLGLYTASFRSTLPFIKAIGTPKEAAAAVMMVFDNHIRYFSALEHKLNHEHHDVAKAFNKLYGLTVLGKLAVERFTKDVGIRLKMEKDPSTWFNGKDFMPTKEQLMQHGMDEVSAGVWENVGKMDNKVWETEVAAAKLTGREIPQRIPGYMNHSWRGSYRIKLGVKLEGHTAESPKINWLHEEASHNLKGMKAMQKELQKLADANPDKNLILQEVMPESGSNMAASGMLNAMWELTDRIQNQKGLEALMQSIYKSAQQGMITQLMDRQAAPKAGFTLDRLKFDKDSPFGLTKKEIADAMKSIEGNWKAANGYYVRSRFVSEVLFPLKEAGYLNHDNVRETAKTYSNAFLKVSDVVSSGWNKGLRDILINAGQDPALAGAVSNAAMGWASKYYLALNPAFYAVNFFQMLYGASGLQLIKAQHQLLSGKTFSIIKALNDAKGDLLAVEMLDQKNRLVKYAIENGHTDPVFMETIDPGTVKDGIAIHLERRTRTNAFVTAYHAYKQIMTDKEALQAAGAYADLIGVPYNRQFGAPTFLGKLSYIERPMLMFTTFTQHMFGLMHQQIAVMNKGVSMGEYKASVQALSSLTTLLATNYALFGIAGLPLMQNWDTIVKAFNSLFPDNALPNHKEMARSIDKIMPESLKGQAAYGLVSKGLGYDVSPSGSGPNVQAPSAMFDLIGTAFGTVVLGGQWAFSNKPVTRKQAWELAGGLRAAVQAPAEFMLKNGTMDFSKFDPNNDYSPMPDIAVEKGIKRTQMEAWVRLMTGLKSLDEKEFTTSMSISKMEDERISHLTTALVQDAKEKGKFDPERTKQLIELATKTGKNLVPVIEAVVKAQITKQLSPDQREAMKLEGSSLEELMKYQQHNAVRNEEINRRR